MKRAVIFFLPLSLFWSATVTASDAVAFRDRVQPLLKTYCFGCHNADERESGIRLDILGSDLEDKNLRLWQNVQRQIADEAMPPEDEPQPTKEERKTLVDWIDHGLRVARSRPIEKNGSVRRLTVSQYRNTLRDLLALREDLTDALPPDAVSKEGFTNNSQSMMLSPLQVESYFNIAEQALNLCIVDEDVKPSIQNFRVDLGQAINADPYPETLILGANNNLLANADFVVTQLTAAKPFDIDPFLMRTKFRFHEGYQGNSTVRGWRDYDSIYHAVFACMRGNRGYPKGEPHETIPEGLLLRPAIPSRELFQVESTYGPQANFKIAVRELPNQGNFRVTVNAAKYDDGLLLDAGDSSQSERAASAISVINPDQHQQIHVPQAGIYQLDVHLKSAETKIAVEPDGSKLANGLVGFWPFDGNAVGTGEDKQLNGQLTEGATFVESPFGQALSVDGNSGAVVVPRDESMNVADGEFTVAAWIHPRQLRQGGIVCLGKYNWTHGWYLDMPTNKGVLRIETANPDNQSNGTVTSRRGVIRNNTWQHVAAVVGRGTDETRLYVNGFQVAKGTIQATNLDNPNVDLHIGRIQDANLFKGQIDGVRIYRRALSGAEIQALVEPGRAFAMAPREEEPKSLRLQLGQRRFTGTLSHPAFVVVRLPEGPLHVHARYAGQDSPNRMMLTPLEKNHRVAKRFEKFEQRSPRIGVHLGLRRDCGHTSSAVGDPQSVASTKPATFTFRGAINDFPSPDVQENNDNYLAGVREISVRSEYTDPRDMPRLLIQSVEFEGPYYETWPPATHRNIFIESDHKDDQAVYAREILRSFATRAFRRPMSESEEDSLVDVWKNSFSETSNFQQSVKDALLVVLTSPQFLMLIEDSRTPAPEELSGYELASKLSYFLWNAAPDQELLDLADDGRLHQRLDVQIARMIGDQRFELFISEFASQWLSLDKLDVVEFDATRYPRLTREAKTELRKESIEFVKHLVQRNLPARHLVQSDFIMANEVVAHYYDLVEPPESGFEFVPIRHQTHHLGGVLSQAGILAGLSDGRESNPVKRGAWLARKIIAQPPDDPPPNVPELDEDLTHLTLRERLEKHRNQKGCVKCHSAIDPWGIPLEQFDAGGLLKATEVDARSKLPDGTEVADLHELKAYLADERIDQVALSFMTHVAGYAVGRSLSYKEIEFLRQSGLELKPRDYPMQDMIRLIIHSDLFLKK